MLLSRWSRKHVLSWRLVLGELLRAMKGSWVHILRAELVRGLRLPKSSSGVSRWSYCLEYGLQHTLTLRRVVAYLSKTLFSCLWLVFGIFKRLFRGGKSTHSCYWRHLLFCSLLSWTVPYLSHHFFFSDNIK